MILHPLFHWTLSERRGGISRRGLVPRSRPVCSSVRMGYVCVAASPSQAWALSAAVFGQRGESWDLWQVSLDPGDSVEVLPFFGNRVEEIRVHNRIPKSRLWLVGERVVPLSGRRW